MCRHDHMHRNPAGIENIGGLTAVKSVDLCVPEHAIASIIGPNGAGKTTLFNCISGYYMPEEGQILFYGMTIQGLPTYKVAALGIARTYQNIRLFADMTAIQNVIVGQYPRLSRIGWMQYFQQAASGPMKSRPSKKDGAC